MRPGELVKGRYRIQDCIGRGGTATVYCVEDLVQGGTRALKMLSVMGPSAREKLGRRLRLEARLMGEIAHPNVLQVHDIGDYDGRDWLVTDLAECNLLDRVMSAPVAPADVVAWMLQILSALAAAHDAGVVHRDVKPENILLDSAGRALLADFGIALVEDTAVQHTRTGVTMGSMEYMPPEQRLDAHQVDHRADLYSTGACLFRLLSGRSAVDLFMVDADSSRLSRMPRMLRSVILRSTRHAPGDRYGSARQMASALSAALEEARDMPMIQRAGREGGPAAQPTMSDTRLALAWMGPEFELAPLLDVVPIDWPTLSEDAPAEAPLPADEPDRLAELLSLALLDTAPEERFDRHTRMAQRMLDVPIALVSLVDGDRQWFKSRQGLDATQTPREHAFCAHAILEPDRMLEVPDATADPRFRDNPLVAGAPDIRFYAGCPVRGPSGQPVGTLCVIDRTPRRLDRDQRALLRDIADMVEAELRREGAISTDAETGLSDLAGFQAQARQVLAYSRPANRPITLIHFSLSAPDSSGARVDALRFAQGLLESWGDADVLSRVSEREFCVLSSSGEDPADRIERLHRAVGPMSEHFRWVSVTLDPGSKASVAALLGRGEAELNRHMESSTPEGPTPLP